MIAIRIWFLDAAAPGRSPLAASLECAARMEVKGSPVLFTPGFSRALSSTIARQIRAKRKGFEMLLMVTA